MSSRFRHLPLAAARPVLFSRPWGGRRLPDLYTPWLDISGIPISEPVGEAWLVADHPECESSLEVPAAFTADVITLRDWMKQDADWLLGTRAQPTPAGRFPLLLKLIHATEWLSVQVHPDDETARRLGEPDVGKTEMWTFIDTAPESLIIAGLREGVSRQEVVEIIRRTDREIERYMQSRRPRRGESILIPAGTLHAIGPDLLLAEIQQNSNITYRVYDWDRVDARGGRRPLHPEKSLAAIRWDLTAPVLTPGETYREGAVTLTTLGCCPYFRAERAEISYSTDFFTSGESFHLLLSFAHALTVRALDCTLTARPAQAVIVPAGVKHYQVEGAAAFFRYYVP